MDLSVNPGARALIFDLDGTLSDSLPVHLAVWDELGKELGFSFDRKVALEMTGMPTIAFAKRAIRDNHLPVSPAELVILKHQKFHEFVHLIKPVEEVAAIMKEYHGKLPMSVGTGASRESALMQLSLLGFTHYFDFIVTADDVTRHKPESDTFLRCAALMGIEPAFCQVFEDGHLGMEAARSAGMMLTDVRPYINYGEWIHS